MTMTTKNQQVFGGDWTEDKLNRLRKYLGAYATIMRKQPFQYSYIDAFAGAGYRTVINDNTDEEQNSLLFPGYIESETEKEKIFPGSARIALEVSPKFSKYIFIEKNKNNISELNKLKRDFINSDIAIINSDANDYLNRLCKETNWKNNRAVLFLDPYGMQVPWSTIELIAETKAIDMWYLFPLIGVNRLLTVKGQILKSHEDKLNQIFGNTDWYEAFYQTSEQLSLFNEHSDTEKIADDQSIRDYFLQRLKTIFPGVAKNPLILRNSKSSPQYLLYFAAANPKGSPTAIKIAEYILNK